MLPHAIITGRPIHGGKKKAKSIPGQTARSANVITLVPTSRSSEISLRSTTDELPSLLGDDITGAKVVLILADKHPLIFDHAFAGQSAGHATDKVGWRAAQTANSTEAKAGFNFAILPRGQSLLLQIRQTSLTHGIPPP
jgi:hypothetical protein